MGRTTSHDGLARASRLRELICFSWAVPWCWFFSSACDQRSFSQRRDANAEGRNVLSRVLTILVIAIHEFDLRIGSRRPPPMATSRPPLTLFPRRRSQIPISIEP